VRALSKVTDQYDLAVLPRPDGIAFDAARLARIGARLVAQPELIVARQDKAIDVRPYVADVDVLDQPASRRLCAILDWPDAPALLRVRVRVTPTGSAKPTEIARALGVPDAWIARLGFHAILGDGTRADPLALAVPVDTLPGNASALREIQL
jgi:hypothetical protein